MMGDKPVIKENEQIKLLKSYEYNYLFDESSGRFWRWGKTRDDDPDYSPYGPEIADIELSTICSGIDNVPCLHCYKSNGFSGENMSLDTFKKVFHHLNKGQLTQIAFGIGDIDISPYLFDIMKYCRKNGVIPNITINGARLTEPITNQLTSLCGAIAVSRYDQKDVCYNAAKRLTDNGHKQINIHQLVSSETYDNCLETIQDIKTDPRLSKLNALVFLSLKPKGLRNRLTKLSYSKWTNLINMSLSNNLPIGFDSCSAPIFTKATKNHKNQNDFKEAIEPCESLLFSVYVNVKGEVYPCSFSETNSHYIGNAKNDNLKNIWNCPKSKEWRKQLLKTEHNNCRSCPIFDIY